MEGEFTKRGKAVYGRQNTQVLTGPGERTLTQRDLKQLEEGTLPGQASS